MANTIRIKRRAAGGAAGAPSSLANAELAYNEQDDTLYYGTGTGGAGGTATSVIAIGGPGAFQAKDSDLTAVAGLSTTGMIARTGTGTAATRTITGPAAGVSVTNGDGVSGNPTIALANDLAAVEGLAANGIAARTATDTWAVRTITAPAAGVTISNGDGVAGNPTLALANDLAGLEGLATNGIPARTATDTWAVRTITGTSGRITVTNGDGVSGNPTIDHATLTMGGSGVGTFTKVTVDTYGHVTSTATASISDLSAPTGSVSFGSQKITSLADPTAAQDAATKAYVDAAAQGIDHKQSVIVATTANITLSGTQTIDGVAVVAGNRVLVKNQTTTSQNGIYDVAAGAWTRSTDMDAWSEVPSAFTFVEQGTSQADTSWVCTADQGGTLGTTAITWVQFGSASAYTAGDGLQLAGNTFSVLLDGSTLSVSGSGVRINATYAGQNTITTLGTITTGVWNGTTIAVANGGTGATTLTGLVKGNGTSAFTAATAGTDYLDPSSTIDGGTF